MEKIMRIVTKANENYSIFNYGVVGRDTNLCDSLGNPLYVGDKVLVVPAIFSDVETSFVVKPANFSRKTADHYIAGYEGITIYNEYDGSVEDLFGMTGYDIDQAIKSNNTEVIDMISSMFMECNVPRIFKLIPYDRCKDNEHSTNGFMIETINY